MPYANVNFTNSEYAALSSALRVLSIEMVKKAGSGHPGMPLGVADVLAVLFAKFLKFNPTAPKWAGRDRFVLSAGHGSAVLYALLHLAGYKDATLEELRNFRQLGSKTAGHPEYGLLEGVEVSTGPLGQGVANGVGMAIAERILNARFGDDLVNNKTFVLAGDGCFMEGISFEAMALAGHLGLSNLVLIYDKNNITIDGSLSLADSTDFAKRFEASGFNVFECDGHNYASIEAGLRLATAGANGRPSVLIANTKIGFGSAKEGSEKVHGSPLNEQEVAEVKAKLGYSGMGEFEVAQEARDLWLKAAAKCGRVYADWLAHAERSAEFQKFLRGEVLADAFAEIASYKKKLLEKREEKATRQHSGELISAVLGKLPFIIGGSADLSESNNVKAKAVNVIKRDSYGGNYLHYGIREHAMGAIMNGLTLSGLRAFGGTFLVFADYMRPAIRLSALMKLPVIYVFTHDSIAVGEDGPTHQPIEHLASLRAIPNVQVLRPCDSLEVASAWEIALKTLDKPTILVLSRQKVKELSDADSTPEKGAYFLSKEENAEVSLFATGSEVSIAFDVQQELLKQNIRSNIISMPSIEIFESQEENYKNILLNSTKKRVFIEAGIRQSFDRYLREGDLFFGLHTFGESGKPTDVLRHFGLEASQIATKIADNC